MSDDLFDAKRHVILEGWFHGRGQLFGLRPSFSWHDSFVFLIRPARIDHDMTKLIFVLTVTGDIQCIYAAMHAVMIAGVC
jgi:hypothetical protein